MYGKLKSFLILLLAGTSPCFGDSNVFSTLLERAEFWHSLGRNDFAGQALKKAIRAEPDNPAGLVLQAFLDLDLDRRPAAEKLLQQLRQHHPKAPQTMVLEQVLEITGRSRTQLHKARLAVRLGRRQEALQVFRQLFAGTPHPSPLALEYWGLLGRQAVHREEAMKGLQTLVRTYPGNLRYRMALARQLARKDPPAPESIETFIELSQYSQLRREARSAWRNAVLALPAEHDALPALRQYIEQAPKDSGVAQRIQKIESAIIAQKKRDRDPVHAGLLRGITLMEKGRLDAADPLLGAAVKKWPGEVRPVGAIGRLRLKQARYREAISWFQRALKLEPDNASKWRSLLHAANYWGFIKQAKSALQRGDLHQADAISRKAVALDAQEAYGIALLAQVQSQLKDTHEAERLYRQALTVDPQSSTALRGLINLYADNQRLDDAFALLDELTSSQQQILGESYTTLRASLLQKQADQHLRDGAPEMAITALRQAVDLDPENPWLRFDLADLLLVGNEMEQAVEVFETGLALAPQNPQMRYAYALLLSRLGREADALEILDELPSNQLPPNVLAYRNRLQHKQQIQQSPRLFSGLHMRFRDATGGLSSLTSHELPIEAQWPLYQGQMFAHVAPVHLDAGKLDLGNPDIRSLFGAGALCLKNCADSPLAQMERGTSFAIGYRDINWRADLGHSPLGFPISHLLGGVEIDGDLRGVSWSLGLSQRPVTSTLLSYAGMEDAETGKVWGGVVATGLHLGLSGDQGDSYGFWGSFGIHNLHGEGVADNFRLRALSGIYWRLLNRENTQLRGGLNVMALRFDKNMGEFTIGHGGYYSPQSYVSLSLPMSFYGRRDRWSWELRGSVSYSVSHFDRSPYFPEAPSLQAKAERLEAITGITPYYGAYTSSGASYSFSGAVEYRLNPHLHMGTKMKIERADFYAPDHFLLYFRYSAHPHLGPMPLHPRPTVPYSDVN
ncbi:MAG: BCSC C-terminal domain-containing protein [Gammaproteobacteria bacterium]|nr:BCSC C-terminal domain-containing protein [Gammaproteobacteria bacterium]